MWLVFNAEISLFIIRKQCMYVCRCVCVCMCVCVASGCVALINRLPLQGALSVYLSLLRSLAAQHIRNRLNRQKIALSHAQSLSHTHTHTHTFILSLSLCLSHSSYPYCVLAKRTGCIFVQLSRNFHCLFVKLLS